MNPDPLKERSTGRKAEIVKTVDLKDASLDSVMQQYLDLRYDFPHRVPFTNMKAKISELELAVLDPVRIDLFLQRAAQLKDPMRDDYRTGLFISRLLQDSYNAGNDSFLLSTNDLMISHLCYGIEGTVKRPLKVHDLAPTASI